MNPLDTQRETRGDDLDAHFRTADPARALDPGLGTDHSLRLAREILAAQPSTEGRATLVAPAPQSPKRRRKWLAGVLGLTVAVPTAAYAADRFLAQTGTFGTGRGEEVDTSEWINVCAPDLARFVESLPVPSDPLPPGHSWTEVRTTVAARSVAERPSECAAGGLGGQQQATGFRAAFLFEGQSLWACAAIKADRRSDPAGVSAAGREVAHLWDRLDELHVLGDDAWRTLRDQVAAGDLATMKAYFTANGARPCQ